MLILETFLQVLLYLIGAFLFFNCTYLLFFSLAGHKRVKPFRKVAKKYRKFCVLIPDYKEDIVILETSKAALNHSYRGDFDVFVIADSLRPETINKLRKSGAGVIEVNFEKSTKGKALLKVMDILPDKAYDIAVVLDVDNIMGSNFLEEVNKAFEEGYKVVQAHRTAKNMDSSFAFLDACNEEINNHFLRKGHYAVGLSSALIGSGMAFRYSYLKKLLIGIGETVGEDKELDFRIAKDKVKVGYLNDVFVYDEKIENAQVFTRQRTRWISAQVELIKKYTGEGFVQLFKFRNVEFFDKVLQVYILPRTLLVGALGLFFLLSLVIPFGPSTSFSVLLLTMLFTALTISLPRQLYKNKKLWAAVLRLPYAFFCMCTALFKIGKTKSSFLPTPHTTKAVSTSIKDTIEI